MKKRWFNSLRVQISLFYFLAGLGTVLLIGFIFYYSISGIVLKEALDTTTMAVDKSASHIQQYIQRIKGLSLVIAEEPALIRVLTGEGNGRDKEDVLRTIEAAIESDEAIVSVIIVGKEGQVISNEPSLDMNMSEDMMKESWYLDVLYGDGMPVLTSARMQKFNMDKDQWVISLSRELKVGDTHLGVMVVDFRYSVIETYLKDLNLGMAGEVYLLNSHNGVVYHKDTTYFESVERQNILIEMADFEQGYDRKGNSVFHACGIEGTDWTMYGIASLDGLAAIRRQLGETLVLLGIISLILMLAISTYVTGRLTKPIKHLQLAMLDIEQGLTRIEIDRKSCNEAISLAYHYNLMIERIKLLMADVAKQEKALRSYELNVLHSQINPHFLYNTLDTIVWMAEFGDSEKVIYITKSLAQFFRLSLSGGSEWTTIANELDHVRQYLKIQKERYGEQLTYTIDEEEDLDAVKIPKIILQPIVENSIYHGIRDLDRPGMITVFARREEEKVLLVVRDNGIGFDAQSLGDRGSDDRPKLGGVGIHNVDQRLKLTYGEGYGLTIDSQRDKGTTVVIKIPL